MACPHRRIVVIGATGSGKSTFAQGLARSLDVTFVELDALFWESEWTPAPPDVFRARTDETTRGAGWVLPEHAHLEIIHLRVPRAAQRWLQSALG